MASAHVLIDVNMLFKDITCNNKVSFGGKIIVLLGDFRKFLRVVLHASKQTTM